MSVPVMETRNGYQQQIRYVPISIGYAMWTPEKSKLELATELLGEIMPIVDGLKNMETSFLLIPSTIFMVREKKKHFFIR